jgi:hypothetical protein
MKFQEAIRFLDLAKTYFSEGKLGETEVTLALEAFGEVLHLDPAHQGTLARRQEAIALLEAMRAQRKRQATAAVQARPSQPPAPAASDQPSALSQIGKTIVGVAAGAVAVTLGAAVVAGKLVEVANGWKTCLHCKEVIDAWATRCPHCTSPNP